jgi:acetylornithine aminotransferase
MLGIELDSPQPHLVKAALASGLLLNVTHERVIRLLPPLILTDEQADEIVDRIVALIKEPVPGAA